MSLKYLLLLLAIAMGLLETGAIAIHGQGDITAPVFINITFDPLIVNTSLQSQTITATASVTDNLSGFFRGWVVMAPNIDTSQQVIFHFALPSRIAGDELNGEYQISRELPKYAAEAKWVVKQVSLEDNAGNSVHYFESSADGMPEYLQQFHFINGHVQQLINTYLPNASK